MMMNDDDGLEVKTTAMTPQTAQCNFFYIISGVKWRKKCSVTTPHVFLQNSHHTSFEKTCDVTTLVSLQFKRSVVWF